MKINHSVENNLKCETCDFSTSSRKLLREHVKEHDPEEALKCNVCGYHCSNSSTLRNHTRTHSNEKPYKCDFCSYSTKQSGNVKLHMRRKHPDMFVRKKSSNKRSHSSQKSPVPETKPNSLTDRSTGHVRTKCSKAYKCTKCEAAFVREDSLRSHLRQHKVMANSSLSTALTVLQLQQPVINNPVPTTDTVTNLCDRQDTENGQLVSECSMNFSGVVTTVSSFMPATSSNTQTFSDIVSTGSSDIVTDSSVVAQSGLMNPGVTLQDILAAAGIAGNVPASQYLGLRGAQGTNDSPAVLDMSHTIQAAQPAPYVQLSSAEHPPMLTQQNIQIPIIDFASGQIVTVEGQLTETSALPQPQRTENLTVAHPSITLSTDPVQLISPPAPQHNYPLNLVSRVMENILPTEKTSHGGPPTPFQLVLPNGESVTATLIDQPQVFKPDIMHPSPSMGLSTAGNISLVTPGAVSTSGMTLMSVPLHLLKGASADSSAGK